MQAQGIADIVCVQNNYNLSHRGDESLIASRADKALPTCLSIALGGFSPLQSQTLSSMAQLAGLTTVRGAGVAAATGAQYPVDTGHLVSGASEGKLSASEQVLSPEVPAELESVA